MKTRIIGIDCASNEKNVGIALGEWSEAGCVLEDIPLRESRMPLSDLVCDLLRGSERALIALDAPLGWPVALGQTLYGHNAGFRLVPEANALFRRATDLFVKETLGKQPLDVGADRIARTAYAALKLLGEVRDKSHLEIPLAWNPSFGNIAAAIEVYPAGTLIAHGLPSSRYKKMEERETRLQILHGLKEKVKFCVSSSRAEDDPNALDAIVCLLGASDFLSGECLTPNEVKKAEKEGWIWFRRPNGRNAVKP